MEEDVELNTVKEELIKDDSSYADLTWNADIPYFEFTDDNATACKTPVAASMPVAAPAGDAVLSSSESTWSKKPCVQEMVAERLQSASTVIMEPDYKPLSLLPPLSFINGTFINLFKPFLWEEVYRTV